MRKKILKINAYPPPNNHPSKNGASATIKINAPANETIHTGPIFHPCDESWKNRIKPAPLIGIGESEDRRVARELFFLAILCDLKDQIILNLPSNISRTELYKFLIDIIF